MIEFISRWLEKCCSLKDMLVSALNKPLSRKLGLGNPGVSANLVIVDPSLEGFLGHHYEYDFSTARAAMEAGHQPVIFSKHVVDDKIATDPLLEAVFHLDMWGKSPHSEAWSNEDILFCNRSFYLDIVRGLAKVKIRDGTIIFGHMITAKQLLGWAWFMDGHPEIHKIKVVLLLRYEPSIYGGPLPAEAFRILERLAKSGRLRMASDSAKLAAAYSSLTTLPIEVFAIPHTKPAPRSEQGSRRASGLPRPRPIRFACLGNPREDKGFLDFIAAINMVNSDTGTAAKCEFMLQANDPGPGIRPTLDNFMKSAPKNVRFIKKLLAPEAYFSTLFKADVIVLPYWRSVYEFRTSGVFVEAVCAGKVVICSDGTWMADELKQFGAGLVCSERSSDALAATMIACLENFDILEVKAAKAASVYRSRHNAANLVNDIFQK